MSKKRTIDIKTFSDLYFKATNPNHLLSDIIAGHLMIEFLMLKIVELKSPKLLDFAENLNHYKLVNLLSGLDIITDEQKEVLLLINSMRNKFAHNITYLPSMSEYKTILLKAQNAFSDFTDGIEQSLGEIEGKKDILECDAYVFAELFIQISYDLHEIYQDLGGDIEDFAT